MEIPQVMNEETAGIISRKLEEHKVGTVTIEEHFNKIYFTKMHTEIWGQSLFL